MEKVKDIEEIIADARAEEEVAREQAKAKKEVSFKEQLREQLKDALMPKEESKVTISLKEYVILKQKEADLDRLLNVIVDGIGLSYNKDFLMLRHDEKVVDAIRVLYPDVYDRLLAAELAYADNEGE